MFWIMATLNLNVMAHTRLKFEERDRVLTEINHVAGATSGVGYGPSPLIFIHAPFISANDY